jgi:transcriptional regulator GlxA family with amidase domain
MTLRHGSLVARALALMQQHMSTPLDIDTLGRQCGASRRTLELHFMRELGHGPATEWRSRRLDLARRLLSETQLPLEAVAEATGFATLPHFSAVFRSAASVPPGRTGVRKGERHGPDRADDIARVLCSRLRFTRHADEKSLCGEGAEQNLAGTDIHGRHACA